MQVRMRGDLESVHGLAERLTALAHDGIREAEHRASVAVYQQLEKQFAAGESAEGERWADRRDGSPSHLQKSGAMKRSARVRGVGGIHVNLDKPAGFHQSGTRKMVARPIVPVGDSLGNWEQPVTDAVREVIMVAVR